MNFRDRWALRALACTGAVLLAFGDRAEAGVPLQGVVEVTAGYAHACARTFSGGVKCWGRNFNGQLGDGTTTNRTEAVSVVGLPAPAIRITTGSNHTCALTNVGEAYCWGHNFYSQLGDGTATNRSVPTKVVNLGVATDIEGGDGSTCAIRQGGGAVCWGTSSHGDGTTGTHASPGAGVTGFGSGSTAISAGQFHACVVGFGGAYCWGSNAYQQLGAPSGTALTPIGVSNSSSNIASVFAGLNHSCALSLQGAVTCWGMNVAGQLGNGSTSSSVAPVAVSGLSSGVLAISGSGDNTAGSENLSHTCALTSTGEVLCWGSNANGQLGDDTFTTRLVPTPTAALADDASGLSAGSQFTCAVIADGTVACWGRNHAGQVGDGTLITRRVPTTVLENDAERLVARITPAADNDSAAPVPSASGRYAIFQSRASNLTGAPDTNSSNDVFRVDLETGSTVRISVDDAEAQIAGDSIEPDISTHGDFAVFVAPAAAVNRLHGESTAKASARHKAGGSIIVLRNLITGTSQRIGTGVTAGVGTQPRIAANGRSVVVTSTVVNPADGLPGQSNVYRIPLNHDGLGGISPGTPRCLSCKAVSVSGVDLGEDSNGESTDPVVSADGRFVAWHTRASNSIEAVPSPCSNATGSVVIRDMVTGAASRISPPPALPVTACGTTGTTRPDMDWAARTLVFQSDQGLLPEATSGRQEIYAVDLSSGQLELVSRGPAGTPSNADSIEPSISGDGTTIAFASDATNLDPARADANGVADLHARVLGGSLTGGRDAVRRLSLGTDGAQANQPARRARLTYNASRIFFDSAATNLVPGAAGFNDVYVRAVPANVDRLFESGFD
jgi:alpha-tubulin suppressor-like RCC1 family protein